MRIVSQNGLLDIGLLSTDVLSISDQVNERGNYEIALFRDGNGFLLGEYASIELCKNAMNGVRWCMQDSRIIAVQFPGPDKPPRAWKECRSQS